MKREINATSLENSLAVSWAPVATPCKQFPKTWCLPDLQRFAVLVLLNLRCPAQESYKSRPCKQGFSREGSQISRKMGAQSEGPDHPCKFTPALFLKNC